LRYSQLAAERESGYSLSSIGHYPKRLADRQQIGGRYGQTVREGVFVVLVVLPAERFTPVAGFVPPQEIPTAITGSGN